MRALAAVLAPFYIGNSLRNPFKVGDHYDGLVRISSVQTSYAYQLTVTIDEPIGNEVAHISWGDGTAQDLVCSGTRPQVTHNYSSTGVFNVVVTTDNGSDISVYTSHFGHMESWYWDELPRIELRECMRNAKIRYGNFAFVENLVSLSLDELGANAFDGLYYTAPGCPNLKRAVVSGDLSSTSLTGTILVQSTFMGCEKLSDVTLDNVVLPSGKSVTGMFAWCRSLSGIKNINSDDLIVRGLAANSTSTSFTNTYNLFSYSAFRRVPVQVSTIGAGMFLGCSDMVDPGIDMNGVTIADKAFSGTSIPAARAYEILSAEAADVYGLPFDEHREFVVDDVVEFSGGWSTPRKNLAIVKTFCVKKVKTTYTTSPLTPAFSTSFVGGSAYIEHVEISIADDTKYLRALLFANATYPASSLKHAVVDAAKCYMSTGAINTGCPVLDEVTFKRQTMQEVRDIEQSTTSTNKNFPFKAPENLVFHCTDGDIRCVGGVWTDFPA